MGDKAGIIAEWVVAALDDAGEPAEDMEIQEVAIDADDRIVVETDRGTFMIDVTEK